MNTKTKQEWQPFKITFSSSALGKGGKSTYISGYEFYNSRIEE